jgi:hypothetical protein
VRLLSTSGPCSPGRENVLVAICTLAALPSGRRALLAAGAEAAIRAAAAAAAAAGGARRSEAQRVGAIQKHARTALESFKCPPGERLRVSLAVVSGGLRLAPPKCSACGAAEPPGGGPLQKCTGCDGPERWCSKECQRASWKAGHKEVCKERRAARKEPARSGGCLFATAPPPVPLPRALMTCATRVSR